MLCYDVMLIGRKFTADEAMRAGLVSQVWPVSSFMTEVMTRARATAQFPPQALRDTKVCIIHHDHHHNHEGQHLMRFDGI